MSALANFPLEGDGIIENLFYYLWCKDELDHGPAINIPDTIIYKYRQPAFWYFTAKDGTVKRKNKGNLVNVRIEEAFTRKATGSDIIAYYISTGSEDGENQNTTIEYFNKETFHDFLYNREKVNNGIVQKFIEPKGVSNTMTRSIWSPKVCLVERRINIRNLQDRRFGMYERAVTYEGAEFNSSPAPVRGSILPSQIQRLCETMVEHVAEVSFQKYKISRLVSNFKIDSQDRVWFLWSSSLRLEGETMLIKGTDVQPKGPLNIDSVVRLPSHVRLGGKNFNHQCYRCYACGQDKPVQQQYQVPYKTIIAHFEQLLALLQQDLKIKQQLTGNTGLGIEWPPAPEVIESWGGGSCVGFPKSMLDAEQGDSGPPTAEEVEIPPVIRELHPKMMITDYRRYRNDPLFMYKSLTVCEDCFLVYAEVMNSSSIQNLSIGAGIGGGGSVGSRAQMRKQKLQPLDGSGVMSTTQHARLPADTWKVEMAETGNKSRRSNQGTNTRSMPQFPTRITAETLSSGAGGGGYDHEDYDDEEDAIDWSAGGDDNGMNFTVDADDFGDQSAPPSALPQPPKLTSLQEREEQFFKDLYHNPNLQKSHPLSHMISGEAKLKAANAQLMKSKPTLGSSASRSRSTRGGINFVGADASASPYNLTQKVKETKGRRRVRGTGRKSGYSSVEMPDSPMKGAAAIQSIGPTESAIAHREFLLQTLQDVKDQLGNPPPFLDNNAAGEQGASADLE
jgi:hypothetical protein